MIHTMKRFRSNKEIKVYVVSSFVEILGYITLRKDCIATSQMFFVIGDR